MCRFYKTTRCLSFSWSWWPCPYSSGSQRPNSSAAASYKTHTRETRDSNNTLCSRLPVRICNKPTMTYLAIIDLGYSKLKPATDRVSNFLVSVYGKAIETRYTTKWSNWPLLSYIVLISSFQQFVTKFKTLLRNVTCNRSFFCSF